MGISNYNQGTLRMVGMRNFTAGCCIIPKAICGRKFWQEHLCTPYLIVWDVDWVHVSVSFTGFVSLAHLLTMSISRLRQRYLLILSLLASWCGLKETDRLHCLLNDCKDHKHLNHHGACHYKILWYLLHKSLWGYMLPVPTSSILPPMF